MTHGPADKRGRESFYDPLGRPRARKEDYNLAGLPEEQKKDSRPLYQNETQVLQVKSVYKFLGDPLSHFLGIRMVLFTLLLWAVERLRGFS
jgi:hypothetical protein